MYAGDIGTKPRTTSLACFGIEKDIHEATGGATMRLISVQETFGTCSGGLERTKPVSPGNPPSPVSRRKTGRQQPKTWYILEIQWLARQVRAVSAVRLSQCFLPRAPDFKYRLLSLFFFFFCARFSLFSCPRYGFGWGLRSGLGLLGAGAGKRASVEGPLSTRSYTQP